MSAWHKKGNKGVHSWKASKNFHYINTNNEVPKEGICSGCEVKKFEVEE